MPSQRIYRTVSFEETTGDYRRKLRAAFSMSTAGVARETVYRTINAIASCVFAAAFGGVALAAWETTITLLAAKWSAQFETPPTGEGESDAADVNPRGHGGRKVHDEHFEPAPSRNWGPCPRTVAPAEVTHAELIQIHKSQIK